MNFEFSEDQTRIRGAVREFAEAEIAPRVAQWEREGHFPREILGELARMGLMGMMVPEVWGGAGADALSYVLVVEELARVCASTAVIVRSTTRWPAIRSGSSAPMSRRRRS